MRESVRKAPNPRVRQIWDGRDVRLSLRLALQSRADTTP